MMRIDEPGLARGEPAPFLRLGFRPFYFAAAAFAAVSVPLWLASYLDILHAAQINLLWHMHEMVLGFAMAVVIGFLFTAARNWTGLWTPRGPTLAAFALLWLAGRVGMATGQTWTAALLDLPLVPLAAYALFRVLKASGKTRNVPLVGILALVSLCNLCYHLSALGVVAANSMTPLHAAVLLIVLLATVMGSRVIPGFTSAATATKTSADPRADMVAVAAIAACFAAWIAGAPGLLVLVLSVVGAAAHFWRMRGWGTAGVAGQPLLWILHVAFAWLGAGIVMLGIAAWQHASTSTAFHALSIGAMSSMIVGMMVRTTRGHTGQKMVAGPVDVAMFTMIQLSVSARILANVCGETMRPFLLAASALLWCLTFLLYLKKFAPALFQPRADGREG